jgi:hypothetical protein
MHRFWVLLKIYAQNAVQVTATPSYVFSGFLSLIFIYFQMVWDLVDFFCKCIMKIILLFIEKIKEFIPFFCLRKSLSWTILSGSTYYFGWLYPLMPKAELLLLETWNNSCIV